MATDDWHLHLQFSHDKYTPPFADVVYRYDQLSKAVEDFISISRRMHRTRHPDDPGSEIDSVIEDEEIIGDAMTALIGNTSIDKEIAIYSQYGNVMLRVTNCAGCSGWSQN